MGWKGRGGEEVADKERKERRQEKEKRPNPFLIAS